MLIYNPVHIMIFLSSRHTNYLSNIDLSPVFFLLKDGYVQYSNQVLTMCRINDFQKLDPNIGMYMLI